MSVKLWIVPTASDRLSDDVEIEGPYDNTPENRVAVTRAIGLYITDKVECAMVVSEHTPVVAVARAQAVAQQIANRAQALADGAILAGHTLDWSRQVQELASEMRQFYYDAYGDLPASGPLNLRPSARR